MSNRASFNFLRLACGHRRLRAVFKPKKGDPRPPDVGDEVDCPTCGQPSKVTALETMTGAEVK